MESPRTWTRPILFQLVASLVFLASNCFEYDYVFNQTHKVTWDQAKQCCLDQGYAGLAVLDTEEKMDAVVRSGEVNKYKDYWVGLSQMDRIRHRKDTYAWETGTAWARWKGSEPNYLVTDHCARLWGKLDLIANKPCSNKYYFMCEKSYDITQPPPLSPSHKCSTSNSDPTVKADCFPVIYRDKALHHEFPYLINFTGPTRSEAECVTICAKNAECGFVMFVKSNRTCSIISNGLKTRNFTVQPLSGSNIRKRFR